MSALRYLGLDLGTRTGWALAEGGRLVDSGVRDFSLRRHEHVGQRYLNFSEFLRRLGRIDEIYYEKIMFTGRFNCSDGHELYHGLLAAMNMHAACFSVPTIGVWPGTLKKDFTGSGRAEKEDMCAVARSLGWRGMHIEGNASLHDEVDAIALVVTQLRQRYNISVKF